MCLFSLPPSLPPSLPHSGKDDIKFPFVYPEHLPPLTEADLLQWKREGVREWSPIVSAEGGFFLAKPEGGPGRRRTEADARFMTVKVCVRTED